jgi:hypothetical protein
VLRLSPFVRTTLPAALVGLLLSACSGDGDAADTGPVAIGSAKVTEADQAACEELVAALPAEFLDLPTREVTPTTALGRAWGSPAVTVGCGVDMPDDFTPGASCEEVNGVGWYVPIEQFSDLRMDLTIYTIGRDPVVRLEVPADYRRDAAFSADALVTLADPVKQAIPDAEPCV